MKKPRIDSKLGNLDEDQHRQLCEWLLTPGLGYVVIVKKVFEEFNVSTSTRALSEFYRECVAPYLIERRRNAVKVAREVGEDAKAHPSNFSATTIDALEQKAFDLANNPMADPKDVKAIFALVLKAHDQALDREKFRKETCELFVKWSQDAKAKEILASGATNSEKIEALGRAMFPDWEES